MRFQDAKLPIPRVGRNLLVHIAVYGADFCLHDKNPKLPLSGPTPSLKKCLPIVSPPKSQTPTHTKNLELHVWHESTMQLCESRSFQHRYRINFQSGVG